MNDFLEKVELERRALRIVNLHMGEPLLLGVNEIAIFDWVSSCSEVRATLAPLLRGISVSLSSLVERSGQRGNLDKTITPSFDTLLAELLVAVLARRGVAA
jgi:hypothetical protein